MPITELALLHLTPGTTLTSPSLLSHLAHAKTVLQNYTARPFYYMQQVEDPSCIYVVGEWESLDQHLNHFIPSAENQALLEMLKDDVTVDSNLEHVDVANAGLPLPLPLLRGGEEEAGGRRKGECVWSITHYTVRLGEKQRFLDVLDARKKELQGFVTEGMVGGGWCVGKEGEKDVFVLVCEGKSVGQHEAFGETQDGRRFGDIGECCDGVDVKHARFLDI